MGPGIINPAAVLGLSIVCAYNTLCTKYILFSIKISIIGH